MVDHHGASSMTTEHPLPAESNESAKPKKETEWKMYHRLKSPVQTADLKEVYELFVRSVRDGHPNMIPEDCICNLYLTCQLLLEIHRFFASCPYAYPENVSLLSSNQLQAIQTTSERCCQELQFHMNPVHIAEAMIINSDSSNKQQQLNTYQEGAGSKMTFSWTFQAGNNMENGNKCVDGDDSKMENVDGLSDIAMPSKEEIAAEEQVLCRMAMAPIPQEVEMAPSFATNKNGFISGGSK